MVIVVVNVVIVVAVRCCCGHCGLLVIVVVNVVVAVVVGVVVMGVGIAVVVVVVVVIVVVVAEMAPSLMASESIVAQPRQLHRRRIISIIAGVCDGSTAERNGGGGANKRALKTKTFISADLLANGAIDSVHVAICVVVGKGPGGEKASHFVFEICLFFQGFLCEMLCPFFGVEYFAEALLV